MFKPLAAGTIVAGRYEIRDVLGQGGMGIVYDAHDRILDEPVALKVIRAELAAAPEVEQRFLSEIKLARRVSHGHVCRIHEYGVDGALRYISMERVRGTDLKRVLKQRGALPADEVLAIALQAAEGLEAIHKVGIVHRDLKPSNIMLDEHGHVRLMDFGIAKGLVSASEGTTGSGYIVGTPEYMSPEQARARTLDARSDVYSLGIVIFELLTARVPFDDDSAVGTILRQIDETPPLGDRPPPGIPAGWGPVLRRALAKKPDDRFASAQALAAALRRAHAPAEASPAAPLPFRATWIAVSASTLVAVWMLWPRAASAPAPAPAVAVVATAAPRVTIPSPSPTTGRAAVSTTKVAVPGVEPAAIVPTAEPSAPTAVPTSPPVTTPLPTETQTPSPSPVPDHGFLKLTVEPPARVTIDDKPHDPTAVPLIRLGVGPHRVRVTHRDYQAFQRVVSIQPGETTHLAVDLRLDGVRNVR